MSAGSELLTVLEYGSASCRRKPGAPMFPRAFKAQVAQRFVVWGGMLAFLLALYLMVELIQSHKTESLARRMQEATTAVGAVLGAAVPWASGPAQERAAGAPVPGTDAFASALQDVARRSAGEDAGRLAGELLSLHRTLVAAAPDPASLRQFAEMRAELGDALIGTLHDLHGQHGALAERDRRNKTLVALLALFVFGLLAACEYRWLVRPMVRMAAVLRHGDAASRTLAADCFRRDEIGDLARALASHLALVRQEQEQARGDHEALAERLARQETLKREGIEFQTLIAAIAAQLEGHAERMTAASRDLVTIASDADRHVSASAQSTQRVSGHVDSVATSVGEIGTTLSGVAREAERTSAIAAAARELVKTASHDSRGLTEAARTIEQVIALIHAVASQTNLLALNATIEAARAGEMGRGFAVVAAEVKQLAARTAKATDEIRDGLQGITAASARIADRVAQLVQSIEEVDSVAGSIATSTREQDANSRTLIADTARTADDLREFAAGFQHVAGLVGDAKKAAQLVTSVSSDLSQQAIELRGAVQRFVSNTQRSAA
jgi:methyl-accepting chemotaxis protein